MSLRFALFGHPVAHSISPAIHGAAYRALGLEHRYELLDVADEAALARGVDAVRRGELAGVNVTIPWKRAALALADRVDPSASGVGAANVLRRDAEGAVVAHNTDVPALAREIQALVAAPAHAVVLGNGGAAVAAVAALSSIGARVSTSARRWTAGVPESEWAHAAAFRGLGSEALPWPVGRPVTAGEPLARALAQSSVIVQSTSAGMCGAEAGSSVAGLVDWAALAPGTVAYDLVYNPPDTDFVRAARASGLVASDGLGMLVVQAALAIELWLGVLPPLLPLREAAEQALAERRRG
jgi:shikimate dehydrogenase